MNLPQRISLLGRLGEYLLSESPDWEAACQKAEQENGWFTREFIDHAVRHIATEWLQPEALLAWAQGASVADHCPQPRCVGIVMAGNIPLVGFHDWLSVFMSGHQALVKLSSKDRVLMEHLFLTLEAWEPSFAGQTIRAERLSGADAYIATGSNNSSRYFEYYFGKYPHIIRKNRSSAALLSGQETTDQLLALAHDVHLYFGLGCRNVTKLYVPASYDFVPLLNAFRSYERLSLHHKYKNNYDYQLALQILNKNFYMTNGTVLLIENPSVFSPISLLHYEYYQDPATVVESLKQNPDLQCLAGTAGIPFGSSQSPALDDYADGVNTLDFLNKELLN